MTKIRTSSTSPLRIDAVSVPGTTGLIGMTFCPGKKDLDVGGFWDRDLATDLEVIKDLLGSGDPPGTPRVPHAAGLLPLRYGTETRHGMAPSPHPARLRPRRPVRGVVGGERLATTADPV